MENWSPIQVLDAINSGKRLRLIDVREPYEFTEGHIPEAELIPLGQLPEALARLPKEETIIVVCRSGARSLRAAQFLSGHGYQHVVNMHGGMLSWKGKVKHGR